MKLSIIIVSYNTSELTLSCVRSIYKYAPDFSFEVIVVDNGSTDDTLKKLRKLKEITLIQNNQNLGFAKANNIGIKASKGEYIFLLNSDTEIIAPTFEQLIVFSKEHADAGIVAPRLLNTDKSTQSSIFRLPTVTRAIRQYWLGQKGILDKYSLDGDHEHTVESVVGAAFLITPKARKLVGILDEKYFMYFEDLDYCRRVQEKGLLIYYLPSITVVHVHGASGTGEVSKMLVESSKKYFGSFWYYLYTFILWSGQKLHHI